MAKYTLIIEDQSGNRGEAIVNGYSQSPRLVSWVMYPLDGTPVEGVALPKSLNQARISFKDYFGSPAVPRRGGSDNSWATFRCSGCFTPRQDRKGILSHTSCPNKVPQTSIGPAVIKLLHQPFRVDQTTYVSNGVCW